MDALREYKGEILEAHRRRLNVHRIAEIFRERGVDISKIHLMRAIRRFIEEEERVGKALAGQGASPGKEAKSEATYQVAEQPSAVVREEEFARQLRIARYLAGAGVPAARLESVLKVRTPKQVRSVAKAASKGKSKPARQKAREAELAKERRRAGRGVGRKVASSGGHRSEKQRPSPER
jgi:hypothetical protein